MFRTQKLLAPLMAVLLALPVFSASVSADDEMAKVIYHADFADPRRFSSMLTSINNMATYYENELLEYDIRIVFNAHGIRFLTDDKLEGTPFAEDADMADRRDSNRDRMMSLHDVMSIKLELCEITRTQIGLEKDKLYTGTDSVPSGVVRLAELQSQGFSYIKVE